ncbi:hypothetical protein LJR225_001397 [Phenylobacterium sp. LjRoot225]|uniref:hypothetical protein n=1 Tax=Phenylobacterium sp. LjRoot225 TaxID=3342285 RepID=UPI003ED0F025
MQRAVGLVCAAGVFAAAQGSAWAQGSASAQTETQAPAAVTADVAPTAEPTPAEPSTAPAPNAPAVAEAAPPAAVPAGPPLIAYTVRRAPLGFIMLHPSQGALGLLGAAAAIAQSKKTVEAFKLEDLSDAISAEIAMSFATERGGGVAAPILLDDTHKDPAAGNIEKARYILDAGQSQVNVVYYPTNWTHYRMTYGVTVRVLDGATGKVVAKGKCVVKPEKTDNPPTEEQLFANNAEMLKTMIRAAGQTCMPQLLAIAQKI